MKDSKNCMGKTTFKQVNTETPKRATPYSTLPQKEIAKSWKIEQLRGYIKFVGEIRCPVRENVSFSHEATVRTFHRKVLKCGVSRITDKTTLQSSLSRIILDSFYRKKYHLFIQSTPQLHDFISNNIICSFTELQTSRLFFENHFSF